VVQGATATTGCLAKASESHNTEFKFIEDPAGNTTAGGKVGVLVVFRTTEFTEVPKELLANANLCVGGSWAVKSEK
jgi:hypothetical protein